MQVKTTRFGTVEVNDERVLKFPEGILGFPDQHDYVLIQTNDEGNFFWLQSAERPELAFVVCDPLLFVPDYRVPVKAEEFDRIGLKNMTDAQVLIIVNKVGRMLTGNLQGPLVINAVNRHGRQLVLSEKKYSTRHSLMSLGVKEKQVSKIA
jgi:flagellar assembly factor FliW